MDSEARIQAALQELDSQAKPNIAKTARAHDISETLLGRRFRRQTRPRQQFLDESIRTLDRTQERALLDEIERLGKKNIVLTGAMVRGIAERLCGAGLGKNWVRQFVERNSNSVKSRYLQAMDQNRHRAGHPPTIELFFELVIYLFSIYTI